MTILAFVVLLALPLAGQEEALHGTWEGPIQESPLNVRLTFQPDGILRIEAEVDPSEIESSLLDDDDPLMEWMSDSLLAEMVAIVEDLEALERISGHGSYKVDGDSLWVTYDEVEFIVAGQSLGAAEYWGPFFRFLTLLVFSVLAAVDPTEEDLTDEERRDRFMEAWETLPSDPDFQEVVDEILVDVAENEPILMALTGMYAVEGSTLSITDEDLETLQFRRVPTAVTRTTWGSLKNAKRSP